MFDVRVNFEDETYEVKVITDKDELIDFLRNGKYDLITTKPFKDDLTTLRRGETVRYRMVDEETEGDVHKRTVEMVTEETFEIWSYDEEEDKWVDGVSAYEIPYYGEMKAIYSPDGVIRINEETGVSMIGVEV